MAHVLTDGEPLLIAAPASWREACFSLPATRSLQAAGHPVTVLCHEAQAGFWERAGVATVTPATKTFSPDSALLWEDGPLARLCAKAGVARRLGPPAPKLSKRLTHPLERAMRPGPPEHRVRFYLGLAAELGADPFQPEHFRQGLKARLNLSAQSHL